jgi:hypothetical protein
VLKLERIKVICPACRQQVEAVATDGRVKGYCAVAGQYVDFPIETQLEIKKWSKQIATHRGKHPSAETRAKLSALTRRHNKNGGEKVWL